MTFSNGAAMDQTRINTVLQSGKAGDKIRICGWVRTRRDSKTFLFLEINDGSGISSLQVVVDETIDNYNDVKLLTTGSSVSCEGELVASLGKGQPVEMRADSVTIYCVAPAEYPLQKKRHSLEFLREIGHLRPRTNTIAAMARLRSSLACAVHDFFRTRGFYYVHTPIISASDCEGAGEQFGVSTFPLDKVPLTESGAVDFTKDFFGSRASLTVSGQLEAEIYALALGSVYTFGPTFRAENSNTPRHLAEFWMIEPEAAFFELADDMQLAEEFVRHLVKHALDNNESDIGFFNQHIDTTLVATLINIADNGFEKISYTQACDILEKANDKFEFKVSWGSDLQSEHERYLTEKTFGKPVIVYDYPKNIKAFYMKQNDDAKTVRAMDVLVPRIGELIGGSEREDRYDVLRSRICEQGLDEKDYWWYLDLRKYGGAPHAGFGLGFERLMLLVTGLTNIRDVIPFPRYPGNAQF